jgi:hypothetical protein
VQVTVEDWVVHHFDEEGFTHGRWAVAQTHIVMPGQPSPQHLYATVTRRVTVVDLEPDAVKFL